MLIPIGADEMRRRLPVATIVLIALNLVIYAFTGPITAMQIAELNHQAQPLAQLEAQLEAKYVGQGADPRTWWPSRFREATPVEKRFWEDFEAGLVLPEDDETFVRRQELVAELDAALERTLFYKLGYRQGDPSLFTVFSSMFFHADFAHVLFNMIFLWAVGANMEDTWGRGWFLGLYFAGGIMASLAEVLASPGSDGPQLGASGAVAAVMGAFMIRHFRTRIRYASIMPIGVFRLPAGIMLGIWFAGELWSALHDDAAGSGVAFWAHVGGFVMGASMAVGFKLGRIEEKVIAPDLAKQDRVRRRAQLHARVQDMHAHGQQLRIRDHYAKAILDDPEDLETRREYVEVLRLGEPHLARSEGEDLLGELWRRGDRAGYLELFDVVDALGEPLSPQFARRAAQVLEATDPHRAGQLLYRACQGDPSDPTTTTALERYADLLERMGALQEAAQARRLLAARRAGKR